MDMTKDSNPTATNRGVLSNPNIRLLVGIIIGNIIGLALGLVIGFIPALFAGVTAAGIAKGGRGRALLSGLLSVIAMAAFSIYGYAVIGIGTRGFAVPVIALGVLGIIGGLIGNHFIK